MIGKKSNNSSSNNNEKRSGNKMNIFTLKNGNDDDLALKLMQIARDSLTREFEQKCDEKVKVLK